MSNNITFWIWYWIYISDLINSYNSILIQIVFLGFLSGKVSFPRKKFQCLSLSAKCQFLKKKIKFRSLSAVRQDNIMPRIKQGNINLNIFFGLSIFLSSLNSEYFCELTCNLYLFVLYCILDLVWPLTEYFSSYNITWPLLNFHSFISKYKYSLAENTENS